MNDQHNESEDRVERIDLINLFQLDKPFFRTVYRQMDVHLARMGMLPSDREDVINETLLRAVKHRNRFAGGELERRIRGPASIPVAGISRNIQVKSASTESEWEQAFQLVAANYQARGYEAPGANRLRFTPYHALPDTLTLIAKHENQVVATFSIVQDNTLLGLPMEHIYADEIAKLRRQGRRLFQATTLADNGLNSREFLQVFLTLIKLSMQYHTHSGGDAYVIVVNPRHRRFYTKIIGFVPLGPLRSYAAMQGAPAEAFLLDNQLQRDNSPDTYTFMFGEPLSPEVLLAPRMPRTLIRHFSQQWAYSQKVPCGRAGNKMILAALLDIRTTRMAGGVWKCVCKESAAPW